MKETKTIRSILILAGMALMILPLFSFATDYSSTNYTVKDPVIDEGTQSSSSSSFGLGQSIGQLAIGESSSTSFKLWSGFQYYFKVKTNVLTATAGDGQASLSWTVPQTFLGMTISSYEVGTGTTSGSYTFVDVGNVTNYVRGGLTNGTPYFFRIKAKGPGGVFLVYSNEATATPNGTVTPPGGGGGGGGIDLTANIVFTGLSYPNSVVTVVRDSFIAASPVADGTGSFSITLPLSAGSYDFSLYATDQNGNKSANLNFHEDLAASTTTTRAGLLIPPTLSMSASEIKQGENLTASGFVQANSSVSISVTGPTPKTYQATASANGSYSYTINTEELNKGDYQAAAKATVGSTTSQPSTMVGFKVGDKTVTPPPAQCRRSDLNCDGKVNLIDFSILLYFWDMSAPLRNPRADIDSSGKVGIRDLSIMLYDWTG